MAFHIPFEHRKQGTPVYIGFDAPQAIPVVVRPRKAWNWWAFFGFPFSLFALIFTVGFLSPIALVINLIALQKRPRKLATAGTVVSLLGSALLATFVVAQVSDGMHRHHSEKRAVAQRIINQEIKRTTGIMSVAQQELEEYRDNHDGFLPTDIDGCMLMIKHKDTWGKSLRFEEAPESGMLRSAGPDQTFDTNDDLTSKIDGKTNRRTLLPVSNLERTLE